MRLPGLSKQLPRFVIAGCVMADLHTPDEQGGEGEKEKEQKQDDIIEEDTVAVTGTETDEAAAGDALPIQAKGPAQIALLSAKEEGDDGDAWGTKFYRSDEEVWEGDEVDRDRMQLVATLDHQQLDLAGASVRAIAAIAICSGSTQTREVSALAVAQVNSQVANALLGGNDLLHRLSPEQRYAFRERMGIVRCGTFPCSRLVLYNCVSTPLTLTDSKFANDLRAVVDV